MSIWKAKIDNGYIYGHSWDDVEYVNPRDYIISQNCETFILRYLPSIEYTLGKCPQWLYKGLKRVLRNKAIAHLLRQLEMTKPPLPFYDIIQQPMKKHEQEKRLGDMSISPKQLMSILIYAGSQGYTLSHYSYVMKMKTQNYAYFNYAFKQQDGEICTNMHDLLSEGEINYHLNNDELINAFILDREDKWFCLCQRKKGILGKEHGKRGSVPHLHFISNVFNRKREDLVDNIKNGICPDSLVHIKITDYS